MNLTDITNGSLIEVGESISVVGLSIVFVTLMLISLFVAFVPYILKLINKIYPEKVGHAHHEEAMPSLMDEREQIAAAIALAYNAGQK